MSDFNSIMNKNFYSYDDKYNFNDTIINHTITVSQLKQILEMLPEIVSDKGYINPHYLKLRRILITRMLTGMGLKEAKEFVENYFQY